MTDNMLPKVSIVIPVYNGSNYLREAIDSALNQTYKNIEVIVVNDGSDDNGSTESIAKSYGDRLRYFSKKNGGVSSALNLGIREMSGDYFSWLSHDDVYTPKKIEKQVTALQQLENENTVCLCATQNINQNSELLKQTVRCPFKPGRIIPWEESLKCLFQKGTFNGCGFLLPKKVFTQCGLFNEKLRFCQDSLMWMNIFLAQYDLIFTSYIGVLGRIHKKQVTLTRRDLYEKDTEYIAREKLCTFAEISRGKQNFLYMYAKRLAIRGQGKCVALYSEYGKKHGILPWNICLKIKMFLIYGRIRPLIKRVYYRFLQIYRQLNPGGSLTTAKK